MTSSNGYQPQFYCTRHNTSIKEVPDQIPCGLTDEPGPELCQYFCIKNKDVFMKVFLILEQSGEPDMLEELLSEVFPDDFDCGDWLRTPCEALAGLQPATCIATGWYEDVAYALAQHVEKLHAL